MAYSVEMNRSISRACVLFLVSLCPVLAHNSSAVPEGPFETTSGLGRKLYALPDDGSIAAAQKSLSADPANADLYLKLSKAQATRRQYREAVATSTNGLHHSPDSADLYLERGHRELGLRSFEEARADLKRAADLNPKMLDAHYHLGLANYFLRDFSAAAQSFEHALNLAKETDSVIDCSNWLYVSLRRSGQEQAAEAVLKRITPETKNTEPHLLFYLRLLRFYQGSISEADVLPPKPADPSDLEAELSFDTVNYGVGNWHLYHGEPAKAEGFFRRVVTGNAWNAWGFIGSELELAPAK